MCLDGLITSQELGAFSTTIQEAEKEIAEVTEDQDRWGIMSRNAKAFADSRDVANDDVRKLFVEILEVRAK